MVSAGLCQFKFQVKLFINSWLKDDNLLVSLCSFVLIALIIGRQTIEFVFVLIVCQNSTSTVRPLCACHALSSLENYSIIEETQLWKVNGHFRILYIILLLYFYYFFLWMHGASIDAA